MGLSITVGILADLLENDPEGAEFVRGDFDIINEILRQNGLPKHEEPTSLPMLRDRSGVTGFPYSFLHYLRRFYATWLDQREQPFVRRLYAEWISQSDQIPPPAVEDETPHATRFWRRSLLPGITCCGIRTVRATSAYRLPQGLGVSKARRGISWIKRAFV